MNYYAKFRRVYSANNTTNQTFYNVIEEDGSPTTTDAHALATFAHAGTVYDFFYTVFGRDSYNGTGADVEATIYYGNGYTSASFDPVTKRSIFGDGNGTSVTHLGDSLDMVAHEFTHGITLNILSYADEAGAVNEAYSDIFAATIDAHVNGVSAATWKIAEDAYSPSNPAIALRYMNDPTADGVSKDSYPTRYMGTDDNGGVHWNSGIVNLAYYLLSQGGTHPDSSVSTINVTGTGINKARAIFYYALPQLTDIDHSMWQLREEAESSALTIYGTSEKSSVTQAFDAVLIPGPNITPLTPTSISAQSEMCYGYHLTSWDAVAGASSYTVWHSTSPTFSPEWSVLYSGASTGLHSFNIPSSGYMGVRACNASGCSTIKSTGYLTRYSSCA